MKGTIVTQATRTITVTMTESDLRILICKELKVAPNGGATIMWKFDRDGDFNGAEVTRKLVGTAVVEDMTPELIMAHGLPDDDGL